MTTYIIRRLLISIPVFFGITILVFVFLALAPGNIVSCPHPAGARATSAEAPGADHRALRARSAAPDPLRPVVGRGRPGRPRLTRPVASVFRFVDDGQARPRWRPLHADGHRAGHRHLRRHPARGAVGGPAVLEDRLRPDRRHLPRDLDAVVPARRSAASTSSGSDLSHRPDRRDGHGRAAIRLRRPHPPPGPAGDSSWASATWRSSCATRGRRCSRCIDSDCTSRPPRPRACRLGSSVSRHAFRNALIPIITIIGLSIPEIVGGGGRDRDGVRLARPRPA